MNILYLTSNPNIGSTTRILQCWLRYGGEYGHKNHVIVSQNGDFSRWLTEAAVEHTVVSMLPPDRARPWVCVRQLAQILLWLKRVHIDIIHCNEHDLYPFANLLRRILRRPIVCHVRFRIGRPYCEWVFTGRKRPDALLWTSQQQQDDCFEAVRGLVPEESQYLVPLGIDMNHFGSMVDSRESMRRSWGVDSHEIVIGSASALRPIKRIDDFVTLAARLSQDHPRSRFVLAGRVMPGDEEYGKNLQRQITETGLGDRLRVLGHLEPIEPFLHAIDIFVSTSEYETFGNSVCEAMACRRPVVAYSGGSVREVVGNAGLVVPTGDLASLHAATDSLIRDQSLRSKLGEAAYQRVKREFDPAMSFRKVVEIYRQLVPNRYRSKPQGVPSCQAILTP